MLLDVPFIPDPDYAAFLAERRVHLHSLHFSLHAEGVPDGRHRFRNVRIGELAGLLNSVRGPKKYALLNSRFHPPGFYSDPDELAALLDGMGTLLAKGELDGIVYADAYLLKALSGAGPEIAAALEAVPSINCLPESFDAVYALMAAIEATRFRLPGKLTLDRSLNRRLGDLASLSKQIRATWPGLKLSLLANEGCLYRCPFKLTHDAHIGLVHLGHNLDTHWVNRELGCIDELRHNPHRLFGSPFIRPEDAAGYADHADILKICGRTLGPSFLKRAITAYLQGEYGGNLLDLTDAMAWLADGVHVDNTQIPDDFAAVVGDCGKVCNECDFCREMFDLYAVGDPAAGGIKDFRRDIS